MTDDAELLRRYAMGRSEEAFAELVQRQLNLVYRAALRQMGGDAHRAEDVAQLVFSLLARKAGALSRHPNLAGWLYTTTHLTVREVQRAERRRQRREQEAQTMHELSSEAPLPADWDRVRPVLDSVMQDLNQADREVIILRFFEERPFAQIGTRLALSEDAARMRVERALDHLRAKLTGRGMTSTTAALALVLTSEAGAAVPTGLAATVTKAALASATAAGGAATTLNIFHLMSTTKTIAIVAAAVALLAGGAAFNEYNQIRQARSALAATEREKNELHGRMASAADTIKSLQAQVAVLKESRGASVASEADRAGGKNTAALRGAGGNQSAAASNPHQLSLTPAQIQRNIEAVVIAHIPLLKALNLTPEQTGQFTNLLTMKQESAFAAAQAALQQGADAALTSQRVAAAQAEVNAQIKAQFGDATYAQYQQYEQTFPERNTVNVLQQILSNTPTPLSDDQASQVVQLLTQTQVPEGDRSLLAQINGGINVHSQISDQTVGQAAGLLAPAQVQMLQLMQQSRATGRPIIPVNGVPALGPPLNHK